MKFRDKIFIVFKILIVVFIILEKLGHLRVPINKVVMVPSSTLEIVLEDLFKLYVGIMVIYIFWPWSDKCYKMESHDKFFAMSAGVLLLSSMNMIKVVKETATAFI